MTGVEATIELLDRIADQQPYDSTWFDWDICWVLKVANRVIIWLRGETFSVRYGDPIVKWKESVGLDGFELLEILADMFPDVVKKLAEPL